MILAIWRHFDITYHSHNNCMMRFLPQVGVGYRGRQAGGRIRSGGDAAQPGGKGGKTREAEAAEGLAVARARPDDDHLVALAQEELVGIV